MDTQTKIFFEKLLMAVVENKALGLHFSVGNPPILKIDGGLKPLDGKTVLSNEGIKDFVYSFLSKEEQAKLEKNKEITVVHNFKPQLRFKVNIFYQKNSLAASFRFISTEIKNLAELGLDQISKILTKFPKGMIIISGPFGSGKSTITAGIVETINITSSKHIITLEDPIEFIFTNKKSIIEQRQVGQDVKSFKQGLEFLEEESIDVVVTSEINNSDAVHQALELAQSGRLVIFQATADSGIQTLEKIIELFMGDEKQLARDLLSENLVAVINLHLLKKVGGGNILVPEILIGNSAVRSIIKKGSFIQLQNILQTGGAEGMVPFKKSLIDLAKNNVISPDEVRRQVGGV